MKSVKPYHEGYLLIIGNGKTMYFDLYQLEIMHKAYEELKNLPKEKRTEFVF